MAGREQHAAGWSNGTSSHEHDDAPLKIGVYGWRKRCLYLFVLLLTVIVIVNLALTIWVLSVMRFNLDGMGKLRIHEDRIVLTEDGKAMFLGPLYASTIRSVDSTDEQRTSGSSNDVTGHLFMESERFVSLKSGGTNGSRVEVNVDNIETRTDDFVVRSALNGRELFRVNSEGVTVSSEQLVFTGTIESDEIESDKVRSPLIESAAGDMSIRSSRDCTVESLVGEVKMEAFEEIRLKSLQNAIYLTSSQVYLSLNVPLTGVMEVCVCPSGKLFFAEPNSTTPCQVSDGVCST